MNKIDIAKLAVSTIVGAGTSKIVGAIVKNNVSPEKLTDQVAIAAGTFVVGAMVADAAKKYTDAQIDAAAEWYVKTFKKDKTVTE